MTFATRDSGSRVALNIASGWLSNATTMAIGFLLTPFLLAHLGDREYGLYALAAAIAAWTTFLGVPIGAYASRYTTEHLERGETDALNRTLGTSLGLAMVTALFLGLPIIACTVYAGLLFRLPLDIVPSARAAVLIVGVGSLLTIVVRVWESCVFMSRTFYLGNLAALTSRVLGAGVVVLYFWYIGPSLSVWLAAMVGLPIVLSVAFVIPAARRGIPAQLMVVAFDRQEIRRAVPFALLLALGAVGTLLFDSTDSLVISSMPELGLSYVATYDVGARWWRLIRPLVDAFVLAVSPVLVALVSRNDMPGLTQEVVARTRHAMLIGMIPVVGIASVAEQFITFWVGAAYAGAAVPVMWVTLASALLWGPGMYASRLAIATSRLRLAMSSVVCAGILNLLLSVALVRYLGLGLLGVATGTLVAVILWSNIFMGVLICRICELRFGQFVRDTYSRPMLTLIALLFLGLSAAHLWPPTSLLHTLGLLGALSLAFVPVILALGLTTEERRSAVGWAGARLSKARRRRQETSRMQLRRPVGPIESNLMPQTCTPETLSTSQREQRRSQQIKVLFFESGRQGGSVFRLLSILQRLDPARFEVGVVSYYRDRAAGLLFGASQLSCHLCLNVPWHRQPDVLKHLLGMRIPTPFGLYFFILSLLTLWRYRPDVVYMNTGIAGYEPAILAARLFRARVVCHIRKSRNLTADEVRIAKHIDHLVTSSKWGAAFYQRQLGNRIAAECVYDAIDLVEFDRRASEPPPSNLAEGPVYLCQVGSLIPRKRPRLVIEAFILASQQCPDLRLILAGDGPLRTDLETLIHDRGLEEKVTLMGQRDDVPALLRRCHIGLLVSEHEGLPNAILEYMASRLPVVVVRLPFMEELVQQGHTGLIADATPEAIADAILWLARSPECRARLGETGRRAIEQGPFHADPEARDVESLLMRVVAANQPSGSVVSP